MALPGSSSKLGLTVTCAEERATKVDPEKSALLHGFSVANRNAARVHPLDILEKNFRERTDAMNFAMLKKTQGIHAPLKLMMERQAASQISRLPFLPSSNVMLDVLEGRDEEIGVEDILNDPMNPEYMGPPQMVVMKNLGLL